MTTNAMAVTAARMDTAHYVRLFATEAKFELLKMMRTKAFSLSVIGFPVMFYVLFGAANRGNEFARYLMASYSCMGVVSACLFGIGMSMAMERAQGWLELKYASPMPRLAYLGAKMVGSATVALMIIAVLIVLALTLGHAQVSVAEALGLTGVVLAGVIPFAAMGLLVSAVVPANSAPGIINLIYLPMSFASGFWMPVTVLPHWLQKIAPGLPTYHLGQLALHVIGYAQPGPMAAHWQALGGFSLVMFGAAWWVMQRAEGSY